MHSHSLISHLFNSAKCQEAVQTVVVPASQGAQSILGWRVGLGPLMGWCLKASCLWPEDQPALKNGLIFSKLSTYKVMRAFLGSRFKDWGREKGRNLEICVFFLDLGLFPPECRSRFLPVCTVPPQRWHVSSQPYLPFYSLLLLWVSFLKEWLSCDPAKTAAFSVTALNSSVPGVSGGVSWSLSGKQELL